MNEEQTTLIVVDAGGERDEKGTKESLSPSTSPSTPTRRPSFISDIAPCPQVSAGTHKTQPFSTGMCSEVF